MLSQIQSRPQSLTPLDIQAILAASGFVRDESYPAFYRKPEDNYLVHLFSGKICLCLTHKGVLTELATFSLPRTEAAFWIIMEAFANDYSAKISDHD